MGALTQFLDTEVQRLEIMMNVALNQDSNKQTSREKEAAPLAEDVLDSIRELAEKVNESYEVIDTQTNNLEVFLRNFHSGIREVEEELRSTEEYAAKFGYKIPERTWFSFDNIPAKVTDEENDGEDAAKNVSNAVDGAKPLPQSGSPPSLLEIGLSKDTLKSMRYKLKGETSDDADESCNKRASYQSSSSSQDMIVSSPECQPEVPRVVANVRDEAVDSDTSPLPMSILKQPQMKKTDMSFNQSRVEISPGLFVKRPSSKSKKAQADQFLEPPPPPPMANHKSPLKTPTNSNKPISEESPDLPQLRTMDISKYLQQSKKVASAVKPKPVVNKKPVSVPETPQTPKFRDPEVRAMSAKKSAQRKASLPAHLKIDEKVITPETPVFVCDDVRRRASVHKLNASRLSMPEEEVVCTPQLPVFRDEEVRALSAKKAQKYATPDPEKVLAESKKENINKIDEDTAPHTPDFRSFETKKMWQQKSGQKANPIISKLPPEAPVSKKSAESPTSSPEMPQLKTINLAKYLNK